MVRNQVAALQWLAMKLNPCLSRRHAMRDDNYRDSIAPLLIVCWLAILIPVFLVLACFGWLPQP